MYKELNLLLTENKNYKYVKVQYRSTGNTRLYKTMLPVSYGDHVVVETPYGYSVCEVFDIINPLSIEAKVTDWVIQVVNFEEQEEMKRLTNEMINVLCEKKAEIEREELIKKYKLSNVILDIRLIIKRFMK